MGEPPSSVLQTPDEHSAGFLKAAPDALRYDFKSLDPDDAALKLAGLIPKGARVLDVGCGTGVISQVLAHTASATVIGIEPDVHRFEEARAKGLEVYHGYLSADFVAQHGPFDCVVFADVIEHLADPVAIVSIAKGGLKPGGSILASVPNAAHWFVRTDLVRGRFDYQDCGIMDATHLRWFTRRTIRQFFIQLGLEITALDHTINIALPDYSRRLPWRWFSPALRRSIVGRLAEWSPELFGCQNIIRATLPR